MGKASETAKGARFRSLLRPCRCRRYGPSGEDLCEKSRTLIKNIVPSKVWKFCKVSGHATCFLGAVSWIEKYRPAAYDRIFESCRRRENVEKTASKGRNPLHIVMWHLNNLPQTLFGAASKLAGESDLVVLNSLVNNAWRKRRDRKLLGFPWISSIRHAR